MNRRLHAHVASVWWNIVSVPAKGKYTSFFIYTHTQTHTDLETDMFVLLMEKGLVRIKMKFWHSIINSLWFTEVEHAVCQAVCGLYSWVHRVLSMLLWSLLSVQASTVTSFAHRGAIQQAACNLRSLLSWWAGQVWFWLNFHTLKTWWLHRKYDLLYAVLRGQIMKTDEGLTFLSMASDFWTWKFLAAKMRKKKIMKKKPISNLRVDSNQCGQT